MKIGILHLTDMHLCKDINLTNKLASLAKVAVNDFKDTQKHYLVISGDIARTGKKEDYIKAIEFISEIQSLISQDLNENMKIIMVPGNHDCNFDLDNQIRKNSILTPDYDIIGDDNSVLDSCVSIQKFFWDFYIRYNELPRNKISYKIIEDTGEGTICFHCHNTAWMSQKNEQPGILFFPVKLVKETFDDTCFDISIAVYHHPTNWFNPNTEINNKKEFQEYLDNISSLQLLGHEHEKSIINREDLDNQMSSIYFSGQIFYSEKYPNKSGFQFLNIDLPTKKGLIRRYQWEEDIYILEKEKEFRINKEKTRKLDINIAFIEKINEVKIPLTINNGSVKLSEIFVFPDIETISIEQKNIEDYFDSESLVGHKKIKYCILEGVCQVGKTSLLQMIFLKYYNNGYYPLFLNGNELKNKNIDKVIQRAFKQIYSDNKIDYARYSQFGKDKKVILIDDFHTATINSKQMRELVDKIKKTYEHVIIIIDAAHSLSPHIQAEFNDFYNFSIKPLGYKKTNDLIVRYNSLKENFATLENQMFLRNVKNTFDQVRHLLGDKILPSYPIFILSILQSLENVSYNLEQTSYGYCYQTLIYLALTCKAKVKNDDLDIYMNYIKELSFYFYQKEIEYIKESELKNFHITYSEKFHSFSYDKMNGKLLKSHILKEDENYFAFSYKYILFFLIAKHIAEIINTDTGKCIVQKLFNDLHLEKNANILVFITHHTKDSSFIADSLLSAMLPFEDIEPITLEKNCRYYNHLKEISKSISNNIIDENRIPEKEREKSLIAQDNTERALEKQKAKHNDIHEEINETMHPFIRAFRSIDIVGQIIKNNRGGLLKKEIVANVSELYLTGFRTIGYLGKFFKESKVELTEELRLMVEKEIRKSAKGREYLLKKGIDKDKINKIVNSFFQIISLQTCLGVFTKLIHSVGIKDFIDIYDDVAENIGTPAAKIVSFSINSYYNDVPAKDIQNLAKKFKDNPVVLYILKARVMAYVYNNHINHAKKQQIADALNMTIRPGTKKKSL